VAALPKIRGFRRRAGWFRASLTTLRPDARGPAPTVFLLANPDVADGAQTPARADPISPPTAVPITPPGAVPNAAVIAAAVAITAVVAAMAGSRIVPNVTAMHAAMARAVMAHTAAMHAAMARALMARAAVTRAAAVHSSAMSAPTAVAARQFDI